METDSQTTAGRGSVKGRPGVGTVSTISITLLLVLYVLSIGPVAWWNESLSLGFCNNIDFGIVPEPPPRTSAKPRAAPPSPVASTIYRPLMMLCSMAPPVLPVLNSYLKLWGRKLYAVELDRTLFLPGAARPSSPVMPSAPAP